MIPGRDGGPPLLLPAEHFAAGLAFLGAAAVGGVWIAPELAAGAYPAGRVVALTHLVALGWITLSIQGALYQFLPVALGEPIRSVRVAHASFGILVIGLIPFVGGLATGRTGFTVAGATAVVTALVLFLGNLGATLRRASRRDATWWALAGAAVFLGVTVVLGFAHALNLRWGVLGPARELARGVHAHVALFGWVMLVVVAVAPRLLPMFLLSHGTGDRWVRASAGLLASGAAVMTLFHHGPGWLARGVPGGLMGAGLVCFLIQARAWYRGRHRSALDPGMRLAAAALGLLGLATGVGAVVWLGAPSPRVATAWIAALLLGVSLFVAAHTYKIVPFLVWFHRFGPLAGARPVPRVAELYSARMAEGAAVLLTAGAALLVASILAGTAVGVRIAAGVLVVGVVVEAAQMVGVARARAAP